MKPIFIVGSTFLLWLMLTKSTDGSGTRFSEYAKLVTKSSATASTSPTSFNASAAPAGSVTLAGAAAAGKALLDGAFGGTGQVST